MACRKAAYRAMTEMSEWMEEQREKQEQLDEALYEEQRKIWTPFSEITYLKFEKFILSIVEKIFQI